LNTINKVPAAFRIIAAICILMFLGCNPSIYKRPSEDFLMASVSLRQAYFLEWELSNRARIMRGDLEDQIAIWAAPSGVDKSNIERVVNRMTDRRQKDVHEDLKPLREKAFFTIEGYAGLLVNLSSNEQTETIVFELNGMVQDINDVLEQAEKIKAVSKYAKKIESFTGPLAQYVGVLNEIIRVVSDVARYRAIRQTIIRSNDSVVEILSLLKTEAVMANDNARKQINTAGKVLNGFLDNPGFENIHNTHRAAIAKRIAELKVIEDQILNDDINDAFVAAIKAQGALVKSTLNSDPTDWAVQIREFRIRIEDTKAAVEAVTYEM